MTGQSRMATSALQPGVEIRDLRSHIIGQELRLFVKLPWRYDHRSDTTYPVLYSTDGNHSFPLYSTTSPILETPETTAQTIIVVGAGYQTDSDRIRGLAQWAAWSTPVTSRLSAMRKISSIGGGWSWLAKAASL